jgi:hypothetical protein
MPESPEGTTEFSPGRQSWVSTRSASSPEGTAEETTEKCSERKGTGLPVPQRIAKRAA